MSFTLKSFKNILVEKKIQTCAYLLKHKMTNKNILKLKLFR